jgi:hypothetical protein
VSIFSGELHRAFRFAVTQFYNVRKTTPNHPQPHRQATHYDSVICEHDKFRGKKKRDLQRFFLNAFIELGDCRSRIGKEIIKGENVAPGKT